MQQQNKKRLKAGKLFSATLKCNRTLRHLDLSRNELGTDTGIAFATSLRTNRTLQSLAISGNAMGANVGKNMAQALATNASLVELDLSDNVLGLATAEGGDSKDVGVVLGQGLRRFATAFSYDSVVVIFEYLALHFSKTRVKVVITII